MKKRYFFISMLLVFSTNLFSQTKQDQEKVLNLCVNLPGLQERYKGDQLYVMYHGIDISPEIEVFFKENRVEFYDKEGIKSLNISNYFLFWQFFVGESTAKIVGQYVTVHDDESDDSVPFELMLTKNSDYWEISNFSIKSN